MKKRFLTIMAAAAMLLSLTACSRKPEGEIKPPAFLGGVSSPASSAVLSKPDETSGLPAQSAGDVSAPVIGRPVGFRVEASGTAANFYISDAEVELLTNDAVYVRFKSKDKEYSVGVYAFSADHLQCSFGVKTDESSVSLVGEAGYFYVDRQLVLSVNTRDYADVDLNFDEVETYTLFKKGDYYDYAASEVVSGAPEPLTAAARTGRYFCEDAPLNWMHTLIVTYNGHVGGVDECWYYFGGRTAYTSWRDDYLPGSETSLMFNGEVYWVGIDHDGDDVNVTFTFAYDPIVQYKLVYHRNTGLSASFTEPDMPPVSADAGSRYEGDYTLTDDSSGEVYIRLLHNTNGYFFGFENKDRIPEQYRNIDYQASVSHGKKGKFFEWAQDIYKGVDAEYAEFSDEGIFVGAESGVTMELYFSGDDMFGLFITNPDASVAVKGEFKRIGS